MMNSALNFTVIAVVVSAIAGSATAQPISTADQALIDDAIQTQAARDNLPDLEPQQTDGPAGDGIVAPDVDLLTVGAGGPCFDLSEILITGWENAGPRPKAADRLIGTCATATDIGAALNTINIEYQDIGLITTRAYLPEQDVSDGDLEIAVIAGVIEDFVYGDGSAADARLTTAFPVGPGALLDLRELEQGYDNLNGPASASAEANFIPGTKPGDSLVAVAVQDGRPWSLSSTLSNQGQEATGEFKGGLTFGYDNLANRNDEFSVTLSTTLFDSRNSRFSESLAFDWGVPVGDWAHSFSLSGSQYRLPVVGINQSYTVEGDSVSFGYSTEVLLSRDQTSKFYATGGVEITQSRSFIEGVELTTQRRNLTIGHLGLRGEQTMENGEFKWNTGLRFGLGALGSNIGVSSIVDPDFIVWSARLDYARPVAETGITWRARLEGQASPDVLPSSEQLSIGSWSTVRGFHEDSMYGDDGFYLRNTLEWPSQSWELGTYKFNAGLDFGYINPSRLREWNQRVLIGVSVGADFDFGADTTLSVGVAHALSRPDENAPNTTSAFEDSRTVMRFELRKEF
ncbi:ShlB/FhaC/HecB family hemolysin secretion/activation protein [Octadecabacter ascidiaceicola]|uniref:Hemolysin transporter protein ShlB n=1 Tax=Octadecabacter ascidiaceicola TaxID=1655543 RepID=A0A238JPN0_9RHOB|nr:ShlB/FhaC/HecB family hemolysin secretion/activation protein [Octadecabacter ascidiaceicola]SMX31822.1 Hemolysin transporter protein ShlB precursor [Octadecabacter ascidiaceicola]